MTRRIVFAGGIQAKALAKAYRLDVAESRDEDVFFIGADSIAREAAHRVVAAADVVVTEMSDHGDTVPDSLVPARAVLVGLPVVCADFLWPFAGRPHPKNRTTETLPEGPYPADFGDSRLDALLAEGLTAEAAIQEYLAADVAALIDLDGMLSARLRLQATLDARAGTDLAALIENRFRSGELFASRHRTGLDLFRHVAAEVFARMGADPARAHALSETHFAPGEMPIHPSVLRHFGMTAPAPDHRYPVLDEGWFTFEEYCRRYVRATWNERLHEALALAETDPGQAIPALRRALEESPGSRAGRVALAEAERAVAGLSMAQAETPTPAKLADQPAPAYALVAADPADGRAQSAALSVADAAAPRPAWPTEADTHPMLAASWSGGPRPSPASDPSLATAQIPTTMTPGTAVASPEPQIYVELPLSYNGRDVPDPVEPPAPVPDRYTPLQPAHELIEVLPRMLAGTRGVAGADDGPFAAMAESMPPPPLRPVLPPEVAHEPARRGLLAKLFGGGGG